VKAKTKRRAKRRRAKAREPEESTYNRTELARAYEVSLQTIDSWTRRGCPHERRDGGYVFRLSEVAPWRARQLSEGSKRNPTGWRPIPEGAHEWLGAMTIPQNYLLPWLVDRVDPGPDTELVVGVEEYRREACGDDGGELLFRIMYGLPTLPPAPGQSKGARISLPHANAWLLMLSGFIESIGGDGSAKRIGHEAHRLRGFPTHYPDDTEPAEVAP
jgi:hypothetical protein